MLEILGDLAAARRSADGPSVAGLCRGDKLIEWQFTIPMGLPDLAALAAAFEQLNAVATSQGGDMICVRCRARNLRMSDRLANDIDVRLARRPLLGRRLESNHLGDRAEDYDQSRSSWRSRP